MTPLQKKTILFSVLGLIALLLFVGLVIYPSVNKIRTTAQEYLSHQKDLVKLEKKESLAQELERYYQEKKAELESLAGVFLSYQETVGFISNLETIAQETGNYFEIKAASLPASATEKGRSFLSFQISLWGDFPSLLKFLANLENSPYPPYRLVEIENIAIKRISGDSFTKLDFSLKEGDLATVLSVKIYTQE